jgi:multiple sugar transport system ATP-binding protein
MAQISLDHLTKRYPDGFEAVKDFTLDIADGEFMILVGPSGCGKSTALRMIAGLEDITDGELRIGDEVMNQRAPKDRDIAMVFQNYALYPHMTVRENMGFALKLAKTPQNEIDAKVNEAAKVLDLEQHLDRKPANLSGGQRQRVAMGRAIVRDPKAFLMDEPLSNLDAKLRVQMRAEVSRIQHRLGTTTVYVTHDQTEAMTLGDRVAVMRAGVLQQVDTPKELYDNPVNIFVAGFMGSPSMNFFPARVEGDQLKLPFASLPLQGRLRQAAQSAPAGDLIAGVRPEDFYDPALEKVQGGTTFEAPIELVESMGAEVYAHFSTGESSAESEELAELAADSGGADVPSSGESLAVARLEPTTKARAGQSHQLGLHPETIHLFDVRSGRNLVVTGSDGGAANAEIGIAPVQPAESAAPATEQPAAAPPTTEQPATAPPTTEQPATERPATERPATDQPPAAGDQPSGGDTTRLS